MEYQEKKYTQNSKARFLFIASGSDPQWRNELASCRHSDNDNTQSKDKAKKKKKTKHGTQLD